MIRYLTPGDRETFVAMAEEFYHSTAVLHPVPRENFEETFRQIMEGSPYLTGLMLVKDGQDAGYALLAMTYSNEAGGLCCWVDELYLRPPFQGKGLGTELFGFLERELPQVKRFRLEVTAVNQGAVRLYQRMGYEKMEYLQMVKESTVDSRQKCD